MSPAPKKAKKLQIKDGWEFSDGTLTVEAECGEELNVLHIEVEMKGGATLLDFYFTKDGTFDGIGAKVPA